MRNEPPDKGFRVLRDANDVLRSCGVDVNADIDGNRLADRKADLPRKARGQILVLVCVRAESDPRNRTGRDLRNRPAAAPPTTLRPNVGDHLPSETRQGRSRRCRAREGSDENDLLQSRVRSFSRLRSASDGIPPLLSGQKRGHERISPVGDGQHLHDPPVVALGVEPADLFFPVTIRRWIDVLRTPVSGSLAITTQLLKYAPPSPRASVGIVSSPRSGSGASTS